MTAIERAIKEAVEKGGWKPRDLYTQTVSVSAEGTNTVVSKFGQSTIGLGDILLNPIFWQALGKARRWENTDLYEGNAPLPYWRLNATLFMNHMMEGNEADSFFAKLI